MGSLQKLGIVDRRFLTDVDSDFTVVEGSCDRRMAGLGVVGVGLVAGM